jgi:hypothetical protein
MPGNWAGTARINYGRVMLGLNGGHVSQHDMTHSVIWFMSSLSPKHKHEPIELWAGPARSELQDYLWACHARDCVMTGGSGSSGLTAVGQLRWTWCLVVAQLDGSVAVAVDWGWGCTDQNAVAAGMVCKGQRFLL